MIGLRRVSFCSNALKYIFPFPSQFRSLSLSLSLRLSFAFHFPFPTSLCLFADRSSKYAATSLAGAFAASAFVSKTNPIAWVRELLRSAPQFAIRSRSTQSLGYRPFPTLGGDDSMRALFGHLSVQLEHHATGNHFRVPLNVVVAAPGAGKTFFLGMLIGAQEM